MISGIDFELIHLPGIAGTLRAEPGLIPARAFAAHNRPPVPLACLGGVERVGASQNFTDRHRPYPDAIDEPARIGDLVDRVDVERPHRRPVAWRSELIRDQVEAFGQLHLGERAGVRHGVIVHRDRIGGTEPDRGLRGLRGNDLEARGAGQQTHDNPGSQAKTHRRTSPAGGSLRGRRTPSRCETPSPYGRRLAGPGRNSVQRHRGRRARSRRRRCRRRVPPVRTG